MVDENNIHYSFLTEKIKYFFTFNIVINLKNNDTFCSYDNFFYELFF